MTAARSTSPSSAMATDWPASRRREGFGSGTSTPDGPPHLGALAIHPGDVWDMSFSPDGNELTVFTEGTGVEVVATTTGERLVSLPDQLIGFQGGGSAASADGRLVASVGASDTQAAVRELPSLAMVASLPPCTDPTEFSADGARLVLTGSGDCPSRVVEIPSGREILDLGERRRARMPTFDPGRTLPGGEQKLRGARDLRHGDRRGGRTARVRCRALLRSLVRPAGKMADGFDDRRPGVGARRGRLRGWSDVERRAGPEPGRPHHQHPRPHAHADGILATRGFGDGLVRLWDVATGDMIVELRADPTQGYAVEFSPDGNHLYYGDTGNVLRRYPLDTDELIELAESRLTRDLTPDECRRYLGSTECP